MCHNCAKHTVKCHNCHHRMMRVHKFCPFCGIASHNPPLAGLAKRSFGKENKGLAANTRENLVLFGVKLSEPDERKARQ
jgi:hypothetical protein